MIDCTDSGSGRSEPVSSGPEPSLRSSPRSSSIRTYSSANSGLPPARASSAERSSGGSSAASSRLVTTSAVS